MSDLTNPNAARLRMCLGDETVEGSLGASSAGQGDVTTNALATPPPLDLTALRAKLRITKVTDNAEVLAQLDRLEAAEKQVAAVRELHQPFAWENVHGEAQTECTHCIGEYDGSVRYPCPTIRALGGAS